MNRPQARAVLLSAMLLIIVAPGFSRSLKKDLKITVREKRVQDLRPEGLVLSFILQVANSSSEPCFLTSYDYRVLVENAEYFRLQRTLDTPLFVGSASETLIALPVKITYEHLFQSLKVGRDRPQLDCTLVGGLLFAETAGKKGERLNVAMTGVFPLFKGIRTTIQDLEVRALSVGGADLTFRAEFQNLNAFSLESGVVTYRLDISGKRVAEGRRTGAGRLDPSAVMNFELPLLLEFFEIGAEIYSVLQKPEVDCRFAGEVQVLTAWGAFFIPFDRTEKAAVRRIE